MEEVFQAPQVAAGRRQRTARCHSAVDDDPHRVSPVVSLSSRCQAVAETQCQKL